MSTKMLLHKFMGTAAAGGYANFFEPGTSTPKSTYTSTTYATEEETDVPISSDGWLKTYLLGDYDMDVFDDEGTQIPSASADGINPQAASTANDPNLVVNGSFETDTNEDGTPDSWVLTSFSGATNAVISSDQRHGAKCMSFTSTGSGGGHITSEDFIQVNQDTVLSISFSIISSVADVRNVVDILWYDEGQATISTTSVYDESTANPTSWTRYNLNVTPPSDGKYAKIRLYGCHSSDSTAGTTKYDDIQLTASPAFVSDPDTHNEDYTLKLSDAGKTLQKTSADSTTRTWTIPLNASVPFPIGTIIFGDNLDDSALTITATSTATLMEFGVGAPADGDVTVRQGESFVLYKDGSDTWKLKKYVGTISGSYTATATGLSTTPTVTVYYRVIGNMVFLETRAEVSGTSNAATFTLTGAPAAIRPASQTGFSFVHIVDTGNTEDGSAHMGTDGTITLSRAGGNNAAFTTSGIKAAQEFTMAYMLTLPG